jgi:hypothetical protein
LVKKSANNIKSHFDRIVKDKIKGIDDQDVRISLTITKLLNLYKPEKTRLKQGNFIINVKTNLQISTRFSSTLQYFCRP